MKKIVFYNLWKDKNGSALLVAMLVMGVLISISLALSTLIFREVRTTRNVLESARAYYAAESAVEVALYNVRNNLPGWEPDVGKDGYKPLKISDEFNAVAEYKVSNSCSAFPCFDEEFNRESLPEGDLFAYYDVLDLNETVTIPLFTVDEDGVERKVGGFTVEFFASFDPTQDLNIIGGDFSLSSWDVLSWKIYGIRDGYTESVSDLTAVSSANQAGSDEKIKTNALVPSWFGSVSCSEVDQALRYTDRIQCADYTIGGKTISKITDKEILGNQIAPIYAGLCLNTEAREYYNYGEDRKIDSEDVFDCYPIDRFLEEHDLNYLTLTNFMNTSVFQPSYSREKKEALSRLFYRVELYSDGPDTSGETVRDLANITANGYAGDAKQSINVKLKRGGFMPVFNFSLYSTYDQGD